MTPNFKVSELACKCGCGMLPKQDFMNKVQKARELTGFPWIVTSTARCPKYNALVSTTGLTGPHTTGRAINIKTRGEQALTIVKAMLAVGFTGIGVNQKGNDRFIHGDDLPNAAGQPRPTIWSY